MSTKDAPTAGPSSPGPPSDTERALATLWLHVGRFEILKLSTEKRTALADAVDKESGSFDPVGGLQDQLRST